jgi:hypothetical protein
MQRMRWLKLFASLGFRVTNKGHLVAVSLHDVLRMPWLMGYIAFKSEKVATLYYFILLSLTR